MRIAQHISIGQLEVFTTWDIVSETATLLRYRWTHAAAARFLTRLVPDLTVLQPDEEDRIAAIKLFLRTRDLKLSLCDALSYVVVSTRLEWAPCLSFDADFRAMGLTVVH
jgi:predicted nucleic acid-binding protein